VAEGDRVRLGQAVFTDRIRPGIRFVSPCSGVVKTARAEARGRPALVVVATQAPDERESLSFAGEDLDEILRRPRQELVRRLLEAGEWPALRERPRDGIPDPDAAPDALLVCLTDSRPLAPPIASILEGRVEDLRVGVAALSRLCDGPSFVSVTPGLTAPVDDLPGVRVCEFRGPHPAGLPGTQIHHLFPVQEGQRVWHVGAQDVLAIGRVLRTAEIDPERVVALAGPRVARPRLVRTRRGASLDDLLQDELLPGPARVLSGCPLSGRLAARPESYLGRDHHQVSVLPESDESARGAWLVPSWWGRSRIVPPWRRRVGWTTEQPGRSGAMLPLDLFERVSPLRLPIGLLLRALAAGDREAARRFGALELVEEDLALCSYLCPAKLEYGALLRAALEADRSGAA
jgi:Na+-transporting NADH:ubiquinone oxidoreductase subunit A